MKLRLNILFIIALVFMMGFINGKYLLLQLDGAEETKGKTAMRNCNDVRPCDDDEDPRREPGK